MSEGKERVQRWLEALRERVIVADGAMGTLLYSRGVALHHCFDALNLWQPDIVRRVHSEYLEAGAEILETNTFGANRFKLGKHGLEDRVREIARAGAQIARQVAGDRAWVAGSVGPLGKPLAPVGVVTPQEAEEAFRVQIEGLVEGGVDLLILETFGDLRELELAFRAARSVTDLPIIAQITITEEGKTIVGDKPHEVARRLEALGATAVGVNCSVGPQVVFDAVERMAASVDIYVSAMPNAGMPRLVDGRYIYLSSPEYFGEYARRFVEAGANIVGGCCGTTPEHTAAIAKAVEGMRPQRKRRERTVSVVGSTEAAAEEKVEEKATRFARRLGKEFLVSVELDPPRGIDPARTLQAAFRLKEAGIDAINIADSPLARPRMSPLALAHLIREHVGIDVILHLSCRDRNLIGLQSELMGAHALGIRMILAVTGDPPVLGDYPSATGVFDIDSIGLVHLISLLNRGMDLTGRPTEQPTAFTVGVGANPAAIDFEREMDRLQQKVERGARFVFTQPVFDLDLLAPFLERARPLGVPIFVGILPLRNYKHAEFLHNEIPEIVIPAHLRERMLRAGERGPEEGIAIGREILAAVRGQVDGAYLMPPFNRVEMAIGVVEGLLPQTQ
ncbi:MAG: bifunctional homocysteine S-methyltransferase/methylenetetrahydrofolate reductase [candidate division KSB1 bacterium]|nr:bifunctional homocysteine S-methyltransferase/methylenetetrahydrofolate reductase [candidate division KSB1 bacterium]